MIPECYTCQGKRQECVGTFYSPYPDEEMCKYRTEAQQNLIRLQCGNIQAITSSQELAVYLFDIGEDIEKVRMVLPKD